MQGRIEDLNDFGTENARNYAFELSRVSMGELQSIYNKQIGDGAFDQELFKNFFNKQFKRANIRSTEDLQRAIDKANSTGKKTYEVLSSQEKGFLGKIFAKIGAGTDPVKAIMQSPAEALSNVIFAADRNVYELFFKHQVKEDGTQYNGFFDLLVGKTTKLFDKIKDTLNKKIIEPISEKLHLNEFKERFVNQTKETLDNSKA